MEKLMLLLGLLTVAYLPCLRAAECEDKWDFCPELADYCSSRTVPNACPLTCKRCSPQPEPEPPVGPTGGPVFTGECGKPDVIKTRVIGGTTAKRGSWPWQILLMHDRRPMCGGTLIAPQWVVTAAHCVYGREWSKDFAIRVGEQDWKTTEGSEKNYDVVKVLRNPNYSPRTLNNDIALLKLRTPVVFNKYVKPICLPKGNVPVGTECYITGWGKIVHPGRMFEKLQQAVLPVVSNRQCEEKNRKRIPIPVTDAMICGGDGGSTRRSGCHGDSGGPYVCKVNGVWELHGAVSHGSPVCKSTETYTVFARVFHFLGWIKDTVQRN